MQTDFSASSDHSALAAAKGWKSANCSEEFSGDSTENHGGWGRKTVQDISLLALWSLGCGHQPHLEPKTLFGFWSQDQPHGSQQSGFMCCVGKSPSPNPVTRPPSPPHQVDYPSWCQWLMAVAKTLGTVRCCPFLLLPGLQQVCMNPLLRCATSLFGRG